MNIEEGRKRLKEDTTLWVEVIIIIIIIIIINVNKSGVNIL